MTQSHAVSQPRDGRELKILGNLPLTPAGRATVSRSTRAGRSTRFGTVEVMTDRADQYPRGAALTLAELREDPHPALARLREAEPVSWVPVLNGWLVTRWDLAAAVMRDSATFTVNDPRFSTARIVGPSMLSLDGPDHDRHRRPFGAPFSRSAVHDQLAAFVTGEADRLVRRDAHGKHRRTRRRAGRPDNIGELKTKVKAFLVVYYLDSIMS